MFWATSSMASAHALSRGRVASMGIREYRGDVGLEESPANLPASLFGRQISKDVAVLGGGIDHLQKGKGTIGHTLEVSPIEHIAIILDLDFLGLCSLLLLAAPGCGRLRAV